MDEKNKKGFSSGSFSLYSFVSQVTALLDCLSYDVLKEVCLTEILTLDRELNYIRRLFHLARVQQLFSLQSDTFAQNYGFWEYEGRSNLIRSCAGEGEKICHEKISRKSCI